MKQFSFRLDSVLRYRETQVQLERARLLALLAEEAALKKNLENVRLAREAAIADIRQATELNTNDLRSLSAFVLSSSAQETSIQQQIARRAPAIAAQREQVMLAERNVKLLEKLRTRRLTQWQQDFNRELDAAADEAWLAANFGQ